MDEEDENEALNAGDNRPPRVEEEGNPPQSSGEEPPRPIGPMLDRDKIVQETLSIISSNLQQINTQKHFLGSVGFMAHSIQILLDSLKEDLDKTNNFLVNYEKLQNQWFCRYYKLLPTYGDLALALQDSPEKVMVHQVPNPVEQSVLKKLADDVVHNLFSGGLQVRSLRATNLKINATMDRSRSLCCDEVMPFHSWLLVLTKEIGNQERLEEKFFEVSSYLDFLNYSMNE